MRTGIRQVAFSIAVAFGLSACGDDSGGGGSASGWVPPPPPADIAIPSVPDPDEPDLGEDVTEFFFSYDESASTASRDLTLAAILSGGWVSAAWGRTYEFLNAEEFEHFAQEEHAPFDVSLGLYEAEPEEIATALEYDGDLYALGVNVSGPQMSKQDRPNVVLTLLVDVSGSMDSAYGRETAADIRTLLDVIKYGLEQLSLSLKEGDIVNLVKFDSQAEVVLRGWQYNANDEEYQAAVGSLRTSGSTNLDAGIQLAYQEAQASYDENKSNRVIIFTDANANTGQTDSSIIARNTTINNAQGIYFSGVGVGSSFNDAFLNNLTDIGKGTYSAMITPNDASRIMTDGFMRFIDQAVTDVKFKVSYPDSLDQLQSAAEDISTDPDEVSATNFAFNSSQFFLELFEGNVQPGDELVFTAIFQGEDGVQEINITKSVEELMANGEQQIKSAAMVTALARLVGGDIACEEVQRSGIYSQNIASNIFQTYRTAIAKFCGPLKEELELPENCQIEGDRVLCVVD